MYLEHFGLHEAPFTITPITDFFYGGANRGATLEALIYAVTHGEGIIKVTGEVGSGKTMLCRVLMERLPGHVDVVYLANPSLSRDEMLQTVAADLGLEMGDDRVPGTTVLLHRLQDTLIAKHAANRRVVVLIDEAHAMPPETLEALRLLYNLETSRHKLLQIVLFGQSELNDTLALPQMRQLKDRITHHFSIGPFDLDAVREYLMFRMRAAGYKGADIFSPEAVERIAAASGGLTRRVNIIADKSLLAAFIGNTHRIEVIHVEAAIEDAEMTHAAPAGAWLVSRLPDITRLRGPMVAAAGLLVAAGLLSAGWIVAKISRPDESHRSLEAAHVQTATPSPAQPLAALSPPISGADAGKLKLRLSTQINIKAEKK